MAIDQRPLQQPDRKQTNHSALNTPLSHCHQLILQNTVSCSQNNQGGGTAGL
jgi:hypothetical protein